MSVVANEQYSDSGVLYNSAADWAYPPSENLSLFGTVLLPKIYGSNLSELEVASDGMISLHVNNTKAFELDESSVPEGLNLSGNNFQIKSTDTQNLHITSSSTDESVVIGSQRIYKADDFQKSDTSASNGFKFEKSVTVEGGLSLESGLTVDGVVQFNSNLYVAGPELRIPLGTEAARPATTEDEGLLYYNKDLERFEGLFKTGATKTWNTLGGVIDNDQDTFIVAQSNNQDTDTLYFHTQNEDTPLMTMGVDTLEFNKDLESGSASVNLNATLSVTGEADVVAATRLGNTLSVTGATALKSTAAVEGAVSMGSTLSVTGEADVVAATRLGATLSVTGAADVVGAVQLGSTLSVANNAQFEKDARFNLDSGILQLPRMTAEANYLEYEAASNVGAVVYDKDLKIFMGLSGEGADLKFRPISGLSDVDSDTKITAEAAPGGDEDTLSFFTGDKGAVALATMNNDEFKLDGKLSVATSVDVVGPTKLNSTLSVTGEADVVAATRLGNTLSVTGEADVVAATRLGNTLSVTGATALKSTAAVEGAVSMGSTLSVTGAADVVAATRLGATLSVTGATALKSTAAVEGAVSMGSTLSVTGISDFDAKIRVGGALSVTSTADIVAATRLGATLSVTGAADVVSATRLGNTLSVSGATALKSTAAVEGAVSMGSTLSVTGEADVVAATRLGNTLSVTGATDIVGVAQLGNSLSVGGQASFKDNVTVDSNLYLSSTTVLTEKLGHYSQYNNNGEAVAKGDLDMFYENVTIHGNLDIYGNLNQIDTTTSSLFVEDKQIVLGVASTSSVTSNANGFQYSSSNFSVKEEQIHEGGLLLNGIPGKFHDLADGTNAEESAEINKLYEKSFLWNLPANNEAGTSNLALISKDDSLKHVEPFWEVKGGQFRLTQHTENNDAKFVSFAFRINTKEQLELVKIKDDGSSAVNFKTIAKFGSVIAN